MCRPPGAARAGREGTIAAATKPTKEKRAEGASHGGGITARSPAPTVNQALAVRRIAKTFAAARFSLRGEGTGRFARNRLRLGVVDHDRRNALHLPARRELRHRVPDHIARIEVEPPLHELPVLQLRVTPLRGAYAVVVDEIEGQREQIPWELRGDPDVGQAHHPRPVQVGGVEPAQVDDRRPRSPHHQDPRERSPARRPMVP